MKLEFKFTEGLWSDDLIHQSFMFTWAYLTAYVNPRFGYHILYKRIEYTYINYNTDIKSLLIKLILCQTEIYDSFRY